MDSGPTRIRVAWNEHRLLFYAGLIGIVGGLGAQLFVSILNLAEHLLLIGIDGKFSMTKEENFHPTRSRDQVFINGTMGLTLPPSE